MIEEINHRYLPLAVVVIGRDSELASAVELGRAGAFDFLEHEQCPQQIGFTPYSGRIAASPQNVAMGQ